MSCTYQSSLLGHRFQIFVIRWHNAVVSPREQDVLPVGVEGHVGFPVGVRLARYESLNGCRFRFGKRRSSTVDLLARVFRSTLASPSISKEDRQDLLLRNLLRSLFKNMAVSRCMRVVRMVLC